MNIKKIIFLSLMLAFNVNSFAQLNLAWAKTFGNNSTADNLTSSTIDKNGNILVLGTFNDSLVIVSSTTQKIYSNGYQDFYIAKYDPNGNLIFLKSIGGTQHDFSGLINTDSSNNIIITGNFTGTINCNLLGNTNNVTSSGTNDLLIIKYDSNFNLIFTKTITSNSGIICNNIAIENSNIYLVGNYVGWTYDNSTFSFASAYGNYDVDAYILKLDSLGSNIWSRNITGANVQSINKIAIVNSEIYIIGSHAFDIIFPTASQFNLYPSTNNSAGYGFVSRLNNVGTFLNYSEIYALRFSNINLNSNDVLLTGQFTGTIDFDPSNNSNYQSSTYNSQSMYILKLNSGLSFNNVKTISQVSIGYSYFADIYSKINSNNELVIAGTFNGSVQFNISNPTTISNTPSDIFLVKYDNGNNFIESKTVSGFKNRTLLGLETFDNNVYLIGNYDSVTTFSLINPNNLSSLNTTDNYIAKYGFNAPLSVTFTNFKGTKTASGHLLEWITQNETNNSYFNLQYSIDGVTFNTLSKINSKADNGISNSILNYSLLNPRPQQGHNFYRVEQVDIDGRKSINSNTIDLIEDFNNTITIFPNPATDKLIIEGLHKNDNLKIYNSIGQLVLSQTISDLKTIQISIESLSFGNYILNVERKSKKWNLKFEKK